MWPDHCIRNTYGAQYHDDLLRLPTDIEIIKGTRSDLESVSAFGTQDTANKPGEDTGLLKKLRQLKVERVYCVGLAFDFTVGYTAEDAAEEGFETYIIKDATRSVNPEDESLMNVRLKSMGVKIIQSNEVLEK